MWIRDYLNWNCVLLWANKDSQKGGQIPWGEKKSVGKDVGVGSLLCKPRSGDAKEPFFLFSCMEQMVTEKDELMEEVE